MRSHAAQRYLGVDTTRNKKAKKQRQHHMRAIDLKNMFKRVEDFKTVALTIDGRWWKKPLDHTLSTEKYMLKAIDMRQVNKLIRVAKSENDCVKHYDISHLDIMYKSPAKRAMAMPKVKYRETLMLCSS
jgi:hypothetical protein